MRNEKKLQSSWHAGSSPRRKRRIFSLRLGHARVLTPPRGVIHYTRAASLPPGGGLHNEAFRHSEKQHQLSTLNSQLSTLKTPFRGGQMTSRGGFNKIQSKRSKKEKEKYEKGLFDSSKRQDL